jgi:hypothetical protein
MNELRDALVAALKGEPLADGGKAVAEMIAGVVAPRMNIERVGTFAQPLPSSELHRTPSRPRKPSLPPMKTNGSLPKGELAILTAVAQHPNGVDRPQLTALTGYKRSTRDTYIQRLMEKEMIHEKYSKIWLHTAGAAILGSSFKPLPTGDALLQHWLERLPQGESLVLGMLARCYPEPVTRERVTESTGYKRSTRDTYLQRLEKRKLVELAHGSVVASRHLFDEKKKVGT